MYSENFNQNLYIDGKLVSGISSLDISYRSNINLRYEIDCSGVNDFISGPVRADLSVGFYGNTHDPFLQYTGNKLFSGSIQYGDRYLNFYSGALNRYSLRYEYGSPISIGANCTVYGDMASLNNTGNYTLIKNSGLLPIYNFNYLDVNFNNNFSKNDVRSLELVISTDRNDVYEIGKYLPTDIQLVYPVLLGLNFSFKLDEFDFEDIRKNIKTTEYNSLNLRLRDFSSTAIKNVFTFNNFILDNQSTTLDSYEDGMGTLGFVGLILSGNN